MIVGDFRLCLADYRYKRGFAHVRKAYQPYVRQQLKLKRNIKLLARVAFFGKSRHLSCRGGKMLVAPAAVSALCDNDRLTVRYIGDNPAGFRVLHKRADRHRNHKVGRAFSGASSRPSALTRRRGVFALIPEIRERGKIAVSLENNISAPAAVTAVRSSGSNIFFSVE